METWTVHIKALRPEIRLRRMTLIIEAENADAAEDYADTLLQMAGLSKHLEIDSVY